MAIISGDIKTSRDVFYKSVYLNKDKLISEINKLDTAMKDFMVKIAAVVRNQRALQQNPSLNKDKLEQRGICRYSTLTNTFEIYCAESPYGPSRLEEISKSHCKQQLDFSFGYGKQEMASFVTRKVMRELDKPGSWNKFMYKVRNGSMKSADEKSKKRPPSDASFEAAKKSIQDSHQYLATRVATLADKPGDVDSFIRHSREESKRTDETISKWYALRQIEDEKAFQSLMNRFEK